MSCRWCSATGTRSGTGVCFTRDPATGEASSSASFCPMHRARTSSPASGRRYRSRRCASRWRTHTRARGDPPPGWRRATGIAGHQFTVEDGELFLLQTHTRKRTAAAALRIAVDMAEEGLISRDEGVARIDPGQLDQLLHPMIDPQAEVEVAAKGLNASPGAAPPVRSCSTPTPRRRAARPRRTSSSSAGRRP